MENANRNCCRQGGSSCLGFSFLRLWPLAAAGAEAATLRLDAFLGDITTITINANYGYDRQGLSRLVERKAKIATDVSMVPGDGPPQDLTTDHLSVGNDVRVKEICSNRGHGLTTLRYE